ncbi:lipoprotein-releasing system permease protein [Chitinophaga sp. YR627]|uniref:ABC transporter permease n=1 Tax=Chitinophaga sp. YR627 TaxID=1881041 RepID=UPI0008EE794B|nr:ABC transporter permease [Chitinophaga sp. YR627]SFM71575.1 lipoprotein-releasing system permease protein [Chitinophaga sp. YR627]
MKLIVNIAWSLLRARWRQSLVAAIGVAFSIMMFVSLLGFMTGLNEMMDSLFLNRTPHVRLYNEIRPAVVQPMEKSPAYRSGYHFIRSVKATGSRQGIYNALAILASLHRDKRVAGIASKITMQAFFNEGTIDITATVNGIEERAESRLFHFEDYIVEGDASRLAEDPNSIILGKALAENLLVHIGETVQLTTAEGERFPLKVVALWQSGIQDYDKVQSFTSLATAQKLLGKTANYITDIQVSIKDIASAPEMAREYSRLFDISAQDFQTLSAEFETGSFIRSLISYAVGITLLTVSGFGIFNILNMMIYEKMDAIAILKATGFAGRDVKRIFVLIAMSIGLGGGLTGLITGFLVSLGIDQVPFHTMSLPTMTTYPVSYAPYIYFVGLSFTLLSCYLASWQPARKASKVDPVIIIRGK